MTLPFRKSSDTLKTLIEIGWKLNYISSKGDQGRADEGKATAAKY